MNTNNKNLLKSYMRNELKAQLKGTPVDLPDEDSAEYHPMRDVAFLERLDTDAITDQERAELIAHLDKCGFCRQELERLCQSEALFATDTTIDSPIAKTQSIWENSAVMKTLKQWAWVGGALVLLIGGFALFYAMPGDKAQVAFKALQKKLNEDEQNFSTQLAGNYRLDGTSAMKGGIDLPVMDDHKRDIRSGYEKLIVDYPDKTDFRTEFGKYLLFVLDEPELARNELEQSLEKSLTPSELKRVPELHLLLGIAAFKEGNDTLAQENYQKALDLDPKNLDAKVNMAISLYRSGDEERAMEIYRSLRSEKIPTELRNMIDGFLDRE